MLSAEILKRQQLHALLFGGFAQYQGTSWQQILQGTYGTTTPEVAAPAAAPAEAPAAELAEAPAAEPASEPAEAPAAEPAVEPAEEPEEESNRQTGHSQVWRMALAALAQQQEQKQQEQGKATPELSKSLEEAAPKPSPESFGPAPVTPPVPAPLMPPSAEGDSRGSRRQTYYCKFCRYEVSVRGNKTSKRPTFVCHHCPSKNYKLRRSNNAYLSKTGSDEVNVYDVVAQLEPNSVLGTKRTWSPEFLSARKRYKQAVAAGNGAAAAHFAGAAPQKRTEEPKWEPETCALQLLASATELLASEDLD